MPDLRGPRGPHAPHLLHNHFLLAYVSSLASIHCFAVKYYADKDFYPNIRILLRIIATIPPAANVNVSLESCDWEVQWVKSDNALSMVYCYSDIDISPKEVVEQFSHVTFWCMLLVLLMLIILIRILSICKYCWPTPRFDKSWICPCSLFVKGCDFQHDAPQISLGNSLKKAIVMGNVFTVRLSLYMISNCVKHIFSNLIPKGFKSYNWKSSQHTNRAKCWW